MILILFISISTFRSFNFREYLIVIVGLLLPFFYSYSMSYLLGQSLNKIDFGSISFSFHTAETINLTAIGILMLILLSIWATMKAFASRSKLIVRQRNQMSVILSFILIPTLLSFFFPINLLLPFIAAPLSLLFLIFYQNYSMKWILDVFLLLLFSISILDKINL